MVHDVFISYSHKDKPVADTLCANLESNCIRCWIAPRDIAPGLDWPEAISNAIASSRVMVLVFSTSSNLSRDVSRELILASNKNLIIIPFKIDNIAPEPGKEYYLARTHWLDAMNPPTQEQIDTLVGYVKSFISAGPFEEAQTTPAITPLSGEIIPPVSSVASPVRKSHTGLWNKVSLALIILCGLVGIVLWNQRSEVPILSSLFPTSTSTVLYAPSLILTQTTSANFTPIPSTSIPTTSATFTPIPPSPTPTLTATPDLRTLNPANQHLYLFVDDKVPWHEARDTCASWGGYLVTIQDYNENVFVYRLGTDCCLWLGATDELEDDKWSWVSGEPWEYTHWDPLYGHLREPGDHYLVFSDHMDLTWDDVTEAPVGTGTYFVCEWDNTSP